MSYGDATRRMRRAANARGYVVRTGRMAGTYEVRSPGATRPAKVGTPSACLAWLERR